MVHCKIFLIGTFLTILPLALIGCSDNQAPKSVELPTAKTVTSDLKENIDSADIDLSAGSIDVVDIKKSEKISDDVIVISALLRHKGEWQKGKRRVSQFTKSEKRKRKITHAQFLVSYNLAESTWVYDGYALVNKKSKLDIEYYEPSGNSESLSNSSPRYLNRPNPFDDRLEHKIAMCSLGGLHSEISRMKRAELGDSLSKTLNGSPVFEFIELNKCRHDKLIALSKFMVDSGADINNANFVDTLCSYKISKPEVQGLEELGLSVQKVVLKPWSYCLKKRLSERGSNSSTLKILIN